VQTVSIVPRKTLKITQQFQNSAMKKEGIFVTNTSYGDMVIVIKSNTRFNTDICFVTKVAWAVIAKAIPFCRRYTRQQSHKCRLSGSYDDRRIGLLFLGKKNEESVFYNIFNFIISFSCI